MREKKESNEELLKRLEPELKFFRPKGEVVYRVKGESSDFILKRAIEYYASKPALNIEGLGEKNVALLVESGLVKSIPDLYRLKNTDLMKLERFAELSARKLVENLQKSKKPQLAKFITALGIRHVGSQTAVALANRFKTLDALKNAEKDQLLDIPDIGEVVAESILAFFADEENLAMITELEELGLQPEFSDLSTAKLAGKSYIISGTIEGFGREEAEDKLRELGATITGSVTKNTTALILGKKPGASKVKKAAELGIPTLTEEDYKKLIQQ